MKRNKIFNKRTQKKLFSITLSCTIMLSMAALPSFAKEKIEKSNEILTRKNPKIILENAEEKTVTPGNVTFDLRTTPEPGYTLIYDVDGVTSSSLVAGLFYYNENDQYVRYNSDTYVVKDKSSSADDNLILELGEGFNFSTTAETALIVPDGVIIEVTGTDVNLSCVGENEASAAIVCTNENGYGDLVIKGNGQLMVTTYSDENSSTRGQGILAGDLKITEGVTVNAVGDTYGIRLDTTTRPESKLVVSNNTTIIAEGKKQAGIYAPDSEFVIASENNTNNLTGRPNITAYGDAFGIRVSDLSLMGDMALILNEETPDNSGVVTVYASASENNGVGTSVINTLCIDDGEFVSVGSGVGISCNQLFVSGGIATTVDLENDSPIISNTGILVKKFFGIVDGELTAYGSNRGLEVSSNSGMVIGGTLQLKADENGSAYFSSTTGATSNTLYCDEKIMGAGEEVDGETVYNIPAKFSRSNGIRIVEEKNSENELNDVKIQCVTETLYYNKLDSKLYTDKDFTQEYTEQTEKWKGNGSTLYLDGFEYKTSAKEALVMPDETIIQLKEKSKNSISIKDSISISFIESLNGIIESPAQAPGFFVKLLDSIMMPERAVLKVTDAANDSLVGDLTIQGSGSLEINTGIPQEFPTNDPDSSDNSIVSYGMNTRRLTINSGDIKINSVSTDNSYGINSSNTVIVNDGVLTINAEAKKAYGIYCNNNIYFNDGITDIEVLDSDAGISPSFAVFAKQSITYDGLKTINGNTSEQILTLSSLPNSYSGYYFMKNSSDLPSEVYIYRERIPVSFSDPSIQNKTYNAAPIQYKSDITVIAEDGEDVTADCGQLDFVWKKLNSDSSSEPIYEELEDNFPPKDAGEYKLVISVPKENKFYKGSQEYSFSIDKKEITVKADNKAMKFRNALPEFTVSYSGFVGIENYENAFSVKAVAISDTDGETEGTYPITFSTKAVLNDTIGKNYVIKEHINGTLTVYLDKTPANIYGVVISDKIYDGEPISYLGELTVISGEDGRDISKECGILDFKWMEKETDGTYTAIANNAVPKDAGEYKLIISIPANEKNYYGNTEIFFTIQKKDIIVKADNKSMTAKQKLPEFTVTYTGFIGTENAGDAAFAKIPVLTCKTEGTNAGTYPITISELGVLNDSVGKNYVIVDQIDGTLRVTARRASSSGSSSYYSTNTTSQILEPIISTNTWEAQNQRSWKYKNEKGEYVVNAWVYLTYEGKSNWYHFNSNGIMDFGWLKDVNNKWYYLNPKNNGGFGQMATEWFLDSDQNWYYLDGITGEMKTGWQNIDGTWFYFNAEEGLENIPYGAMLKNTVTPDGYTIDENGKWIQ